MFLDAMLADKRREVAQLQASVPQGSLELAAARAPEPRDFAAALRNRGLSVIAEIKRGSPSRGPIRPDLDPSALAGQYRDGGCDAISVLTDKPYFGAIEGDLQRARSAVGLPVLRKDFIISEYQVWESRAMGADAVLLIVAALGETGLPEMTALATRLGMAVLVEVHDEKDMGIARAAGAAIIGINNRNLRSFCVDVQTTIRLRPLVPAGALLVSESGLAAPMDVAAVRACGVDAVLIGEALVSSADPAGLIRGLKS